MRGMTNEQKAIFAKDKNIFISEDIVTGNAVGIYGFFAVKGEERICFYIGKATNITKRVMESGGHIHQFLHNYFDPDKKYMDESIPVPVMIDRYLKDGFSVEVDLLKKVNYKSHNFSIAAHKLAVEEYKMIVRYQKQGQCLWQLPEGVGKDEKSFWKENYMIKNQ